MNLDAILARLQGVRPNGSRWMALCPAHPDRSPSLAIHQGDGGRVLLHCFAGCTVENICAALKIKLSDLFAKRREAHQTEPRIVRESRKQITGLRSRVTPGDRKRAVTVVLANKTNFDVAFARALALAVQGELVQIALDGDGQ